LGAIFSRMASKKRPVGLRRVQRLAILIYSDHPHACSSVANSCKRNFLVELHRRLDAAFFSQNVERNAAALNAEERGRLPEEPGQIGVRRSLRMDGGAAQAGFGGPGNCERAGQPQTAGGPIRGCAC